MSLVLHIGMPKCASSALQTYLGSPYFSQDARQRVVYAALQEDGQVLWGERLHAAAVASPFGYCASHAGGILSRYSEEQKQSACAVLRELDAEFDAVVLSCEGWGSSAKDFSSDCMIAACGLDTRVVAYVRPQVEWINSAWWQWGAWTEAPLLRWVQQNRDKAKWHSILQQWRRKQWVKSVDVRALGEDVVHDFSQYLGICSPSVQPQANLGLPDVVLRLFQRHRDMRPNAHSSAIEFILSRQLGFGTEYQTTPWVLRPRLVGQLVEYYREDNEALREWLAPEQKEKLTGNPLWWSANAYLEKPVQKAADTTLRAEELERLTVEALHAISRLDARLREFQTGWLKLKDKIGSEIKDSDLGQPDRSMN